MVGKIDSLELVGMTEIWMGSFHVADIRPEVGRGTRLSHVEALLENAREGMVDEEAHKSDLDALACRMRNEINKLHKVLRQHAIDAKIWRTEIAQLQAELKARKTK